MLGGHNKELVSAHIGRPDVEKLEHDEEENLSTWKPSRHVNQGFTSACLGVVLPHLPGEIFGGHLSTIFLEPPALGNLSQVLTRFYSILVKFSQFRRCPSGYQNQTGTKTNGYQTKRVPKQSTKTNGYQNVKFSKAQKVAPILIPHPFGYPFGCCKRDNPNGYQNKRVPRCLVFRNQKTCHFDTPSILIPLWVLLTVLGKRDAAFLLRVGSFLLTVELFYLQFTIWAFLLTIGACLLTILAFLLTVFAFWLTVGAFLLSVGKCV